MRPGGCRCGRAANTGASPTHAGIMLTQGHVGSRGHLKTYAAVAMQQALVGVIAPSHLKIMRGNGTLCDIPLPMAISTSAVTPWTRIPDTLCSLCEPRRRHPRRRRPRLRRRRPRRRPRRLRPRHRRRRRRPRIRRHSRAANTSARTTAPSGPRMVFATMGGRDQKESTRRALSAWTAWTVERDSSTAPQPRRPRGHRPLRRNRRLPPRGSSYRAA